MSNIAYIYGKIPHHNRVDKDVREIVNRQFPEFAVDFDANTRSWTVSYAEIALTFHITKFRRRNALSFRHGHSWRFMYWIEYEIREQLAAKYGSKQYDEGIGNCEVDYKHSPTYQDYHEMVYGEEGKPLWALEWKHYKKIIPQPLMKYMETTG